jgi:L-lactate dehydrogenase (cytochrome)
MADGQGMKIRTPPEPDPRLLRRYPSVQSFRLKARRRLPRFAFDYLDGAAGEELAPRRNISALEAIELLPRFGIDVLNVSTRVEIFGKTWSSPIGVSPVGYGDMYWPGSERAMASAAQAANIPFVLSTVSCTSLEEIAKVAPDVLWFQLYHATNDAITEDLARRAHDCGVKVLVLTIDLPTTSKRNRDLVNGFSLPFEPGLRLYLDLLRIPEWSLRTLIAGMPMPRTLDRNGSKNLSPGHAAAEVDRLISTVTTWEHVKRIRSLWPGRLVIKGLLHPEDARLAIGLGCDAILVSNHGGRQFDAAPASIDALPGIVAAVGAQVPVFMDGGIRSGLDVLKALVRGAAIVFSGRSFYYGAAAIGAQGGPHALSLLHMELLSNMRQMGTCSLAEIHEGGPWEFPRSRH